jgi:hypothetical protein
MVSKRFVHIALIVERLAIALVLSITLLLFQMHPTSAYTLENVKWANQPSPGSCCANLTVNMSSVGYSIDQTGWNNGMAAWNDDSQAFITWQTTTGYSVIDLYDTYDSGVTWVGEAPYQQDSGYFTLAAGYLNYYYTQNMSADAIQGVAAHELGHIAGLGHSQYCNTVMYASVGLCQADTPQSDDEQGINALY